MDVPCVGPVSDNRGYHIPADGGQSAKRIGLRAALRRLTSFRPLATPDLF